LVPHFTKDLKTARKPINARAETAGSSGMFRGALASRRCLVPANAFYEWNSMADGKQPYAIARWDGSPLAFAGVWEGWRTPDGETMRTFAILTTSANGTMRQLHERMPVILEAADWAAWLGEVEGDIPALMRPAADDVLNLWPVSRAVNSVRNNGAGLLDRIDDPDAPPPSQSTRAAWFARRDLISRPPHPPPAKQGAAASEKRAHAAPPGPTATRSDAGFHPPHSATLPLSRPHHSA
jgi:putative SOS response-associated peptidase YedK